MTASIDIPAGLVADLMLLVPARDSGHPGADIDTATRSHLVNTGWARARYRDGSPAPVRDWACMLHITPAGIAASRRGLQRPPRLQARDVEALVEVEMAGEQGYIGYWPGSSRQLRIARLWQLVQVCGGAAPQAGTHGRWTLTPGGYDALTRWRDQVSMSKHPAVEVYRLLARIAQGTPLGPYQYRLKTLRGCQARGWVTADMTLTARGQAALVAGPKPAAVRCATPGRVLVPQLRAGQQCRMANRQGWRNLGPQWVTFVRTERVRHPGGPRGWWVWVADDPASHARLYTDVPVPYQQKFEVRAAPPS